MLQGTPCPSVHVVAKFVREQDAGGVGIVTNCAEVKVLQPRPICLVRCIPREGVCLRHCKRLLPGLHPDNAHQIVTLVVVFHGTLKRSVLVVEQRLKLEPIVLLLSMNAPLEQEIAIEVFVGNHWRRILDIMFRKPSFVTMARRPATHQLQWPATGELLTLMDLKMLPIDIPVNRIV